VPRAGGRATTPAWPPPDPRRYDDAVTRLVGPCSGPWSSSATRLREQLAHLGDAVDLALARPRQELAAHQRREEGLGVHQVRSVVDQVVSRAVADLVAHALQQPHVVLG
jgi:hypothetical protein